MAQATQRHRRVAPSSMAKPVPVAVPKSGTGRLRTLLVVLGITTLFVVAHQVWRLFGKSATAVWTAPSDASTTPAVPGAHPAAPGISLGEAGDIAVQFEEDGEMDLATMQRMLDILYKGPRKPEGFESVDTADEGTYRFRKEADTDAKGSAL